MLNLKCIIDQQKHIIMVYERNVNCVLKFIFVDFSFKFIFLDSKILVNIIGFNLYKNTVIFARKMYSASTSYCHVNQDINVICQFCKVLQEKQYWPFAIVNILNWLRLYPLYK